MASTSTAPPTEWTGAGTKEGDEIWRIEKFLVVPWPKERYGEFYEGDSYIMLHTYKKSNAFRWNLHFWLGSKTSMDESGTAAIKTIELDEHLKTLPVQYREVQGSESDLFLSYFAKPVKYLLGGIESGFNKVQADQIATKLFQVKGASKVVVSQVDLTAASLNSGDVFVLDAGSKCWVWNGKQSRGTEKFAGTQYAQALKSERHSKLQIISCDESGDDEFWKLLGGKPAAIKSAVEGGDDTAVQSKKKVLYHLSDASGSMVFNKVLDGEVFKYSLLDGNDVYIVDAGTTIFIWIGLKASPQERKQSMTHATQYAQQQKYDMNKLCIVRVSQGLEPDAFMRHFSK